MVSLEILRKSVVIKKINSVISSRLVFAGNGKIIAVGQTQTSHCVEERVQGSGGSDW